MEIQILKFVEKCHPDWVWDEDLKNKFGTDFSGDFIGNFGKHQAAQRKKSEFSFQTQWKLNAAGRFKLIEWENLQKTRATARWTIVIALASVIAAGVASWFSWQDSRSDQDWQDQQLRELQITNEFLQKISEK